VSVEYDNLISYRTSSVLGGTASYWFAHGRGTDFVSLISVISFPARLTVLPWGWRR